MAAALALGRAARQWAQEHTENVETSKRRGMQDSDDTKGSEAQAKQKKERKKQKQKKKDEERKRSGRSYSVWTHTKA